MQLKIKFVLAVSVLMISCTAWSESRGDAVRGKALYARLCTTCHSVEFSRTGPMHRGVVGRRVGSVPNFRYSPALTGRKMTWDAKLLSKWLANPEGLFPGQDMGYKVDSATDRNDLIEYLATLKNERPKRQP